ncbi:hypothetical protein ACWHAO_23615 [Streptomyces albidoflavus]
MNATGAPHRWPDPDLLCMEALRALADTADAALAGQLVCQSAG